MSNPPLGEGQQHPESEPTQPQPTQPQPPYGQTSAPPHTGPYVPPTGSPAAAPETYGQQPGYPPPVYPQGPGYPQGPAYPHGYPAPGQPASSGTNVMAILSLVLAFVFAPAGIVLGHMAKKQIRQTGEQGEGLATAGLILSYVFTGISLLACCGGIALAIWGGVEGSSSSY